ncbi:HAD-IB family hydrolase [Halomonas stenophila]|uniref:HAD superfamily hydrolase (TIGR01490 family) n=1 Tax=Halomonas stenophila TaxID=795312 RepID=A0A7W5N3C5_9GAMM|nr:HAD superfamily hydrolase (TIGR01490 family) [Halomonas stenophila]
MNTTPVAFFDFDGTLTTGDTLLPFLKYVVGAPTYYTKLALLSPVLGAYATKLLRNDIAKEIVLKQYLAGYPLKELQDIGKRFNKEIIPTMLRPEGIERLEWHKAQGHDCVLVSASLDVYLKEWAESYGFTASLTSILKQDEFGNVTGHLNAANCFGWEKCLRIETWIEARKPEVTYAYGDSEGDLLMLKSANEGWRFSSRRKCFIRV